MPGSSERVGPGFKGVSAFLGLLVLVVPTGKAASQILSPGRLTDPHSSLEGMGNCTRCHQLRSRGVSGESCLECHQTLQRRIDLGRGYHGQLLNQDCGSCHKEHLGRDFDLIRMDPDTFRHSLAEFELSGAHSTADCRACHTPELISDRELLEELKGKDGAPSTYLGLDPGCGSCHQREDPHLGQFKGKDCGTCHTEVVWAEADAFDHSQTDYPLVGRHQEVPCVGCHDSMQSPGGGESIRYVPVEAEDCVSCHKDPHSGPLASACHRCHSTDGWHTLDRGAVEAGFDHAGTAFPLNGAHVQAECAKCHSRSYQVTKNVRLSFFPSQDGQSYLRPRHVTCNTCHVDFHEGVFGVRSCDICHGSDSWAPPDYSRAQHQTDLRFPLTGVHAVTPCSACHEAGTGEEPILRFRFDDPGTCATCHSKDDPHEGAFSMTGCDLCHTTEAFGTNLFDHDLLQAAGWAGTCRGCHDADGPHGTQFGERDCDECHGTRSYSVPAFDHGSSRFPMNGAHANIPCRACHLPTTDARGNTMIRYRPLEAACEACHGARR